MEKIIAKDLLDIKAVFLSPDKPFTWASGIKSPIYCDNRLTLSDVKVRNDVENALANIIKTKYPECEQVIGTSTAGNTTRCNSSPLIRFTNGICKSKCKRPWQKQSN